MNHYIICNLDEPYADRVRSVILDGEAAKHKMDDGGEKKSEIGLDPAQIDEPPIEQNTDAKNKKIMEAINKIDDLTYEMNLIMRKHLKELFAKI